MENLSTILTKLKEELEKTFDYDTKLNFKEQGFYLKAIDKEYSIFFNEEQNAKRTLTIEDKDKELYAIDFETKQTITDVLEQLEKDIIIYTAVEHIEQGWQSELTTSGSIIDFKDYKEYLTDIKKVLEQKGINAELEASFCGLQYEYQR